MRTLKRVTLGSKPELDRIYGLENSRSADYCFGNMYMWDKRFEQGYTVSGDRLIVLLRRREGLCFAYPVGSGNITQAIEEMREISREKGIPFMICGVCKEHMAELNKIYPGCFEFQYDRDFSDYLYSVDRLSAYSGKSLHSKRNFCNRFEAEHEWHFELLNEELIPSCKEMLESWLHKSEDRLEETIDYEKTAIYQGFAHYSELGLEGGALFIEDKLVGFSVGEHCAPDTFCVHYEKAHADIAGAYAMVCREMAKMIAEKHPDISYVNREDDMGLDSLRKSKLSYKPEMILEKFLAVWVKP